MKNTRVIFGIIAFVAAFIFSVGLVRLLFPSTFVPVSYQSPRYAPKKTYRSPFASDIESFIAADIRNGRYRNEQTDEFSINKEGLVSVPNADSVTEYWETSSGMNASNFPADFQKAWRKHMQAWNDYAEFLENQKGKKVDREEFSIEEDRYNSEINRTWYEVLRIGRSYGADVW